MRLTGGRPLRYAVVLLAVLIIGVAVLRTAAVGAWASARPDTAARWWPGHPAVDEAQALAGVGRAARLNQPPDAAAQAQLARLATRAPMAIEPLLVSAVAAEAAGDLTRAERLFEISRRRDGRALAPHYFLAERYLRSGRIEPGLAEVANLARLSPGGIGSSAPYLAQFARDPANWGRIRMIMQGQPALGQAVLLALASDSANLRAVLALAGPGQRGADAAWLPPMLAALIKDGRFADARRLWAEQSSVPPGSELLHDGDFTDARSVPPFNWALTGSAVGLAERQRGAGLHIIFYGTQDGVLAQQLLLLPPGAYRMNFRLSGTLADRRALAWSLTCAGSGQIIGFYPLPGPGDLSWGVRIPPNCSAQTLSLTGRAQDIGRASDILISALRIEAADD